MAKQGRKSAAELSVVPSVERIERPRPPDELTPEQRNEWARIVGRMPADWFPTETHSLLAQYCRHVTRARRLAEMIEDAEGRSFDAREYRDLLRAEEAQTRAMASLATRMRLSQQSTMKHETAGRKSSKPAPSAYEMMGNNDDD